jgi:hypothetical protein
VSRSQGEARAAPAAGADEAPPGNVSAAGDDEERGALRCAVCGVRSAVCGQPAGGECAGGCADGGRRRQHRHAGSAASIRGATRQRSPEGRQLAVL